MRLPRWLPWAAVATLLVLLLCQEWFGPDIWYHLYLGERIARTLTPQPSDNLILQQPHFVNFYWVFQLLVRGAFALGGITAVSLLFIVFWGLALACWLATTGLRGAGAWGAALALAAVLICQTRFEPRPEVLSYVFLAWQIHWLAGWKIDRPPGKKELISFVLVQVLWSNVHGYFIFGPALVGLKIASLIPSSNPRLPGDAGSADRTAATSKIRLWQLFGFTLLATIASPFGFHNWTEVIALGHVLRQMRFAIQEFLPPTAVPAQVWTVDLFWCYWAALLGAGGWVAWTAGRRELFALLLAAGGLFLSILAFRNIPLALFMGAPLIGIVRTKITFHSPSPRAGIAVVLLSIGLSAWVISGGFYRSMGSPYGFGIRESRSSYPVTFADYLRAHEFHGSVFSNAADGSYLEFHFPGLRLYGDTRLVDVAPIREYFGALRDPRRFYALQSRQGFDAALLPLAQSHEVIAALSRDRAWRLAYVDLHRAFFVNVLGTAGAGAPIGALNFYRGEDLTRPDNQLSAVLWVALWAELDDREHLRQALRQFSAAPQIPSPLVGIAQRYGWIRSDPEIAALAKAMRAKEFSTRPLAYATLQQLVR